MLQKSIIILSFCLLTSGTTLAQTETEPKMVAAIAIDDKGLVGVGTQAPEHRLHVVGDALVEGVLLGNGFNGTFGKATIFAAQKLTGGVTRVAIVHDPTKAPAQSLQFYAIDPNNPNAATFKTFVIPHPVDASRFLVHATLEGPEGAVFYRGSARLQGGKATIELPDYFESLTRPEGRTVLLTNVDGFDRLAVRTEGGARIAEGRFEVISDNPFSTQAFDWEVKAVRRDGPPLEVEPLRSERAVRGFGPYTFAVPIEASQPEEGQP